MISSKNVPKSSMPALIFVVAVMAIALIGLGITRSRHTTVNTSGKLQIVAAENFWGSLAAQLGGSRVHVYSIVSDPNADPHEYESNNYDARSIATANYVILNGVGYDTWANKLLDASPNKGRKILTIASLVGVKNGANPHLWYDPGYVNQAVIQMDRDLISLDPGGKSYYVQQLKILQASLAVYQQRIANIKQQFGGTKVAATEDIFSYLAASAGLDLISPPAFIEAVAEGNDPPTASIVQFQQQLESGQIKVLVYNKQTITPLTSSIKKQAAIHNIPIVGVTETILPENALFQNWMSAELINLQKALQDQANGK